MEQPLDERLPLAAASLLTLLGPEFEGAAIEGAVPLSQRSRNQLLRLQLRDAPAPTVILKIVRAAHDRFWDHHLRREHRVLELLARWWPGGAPKPFAAVFSGDWGVLLLEDVGPVSLAETLGAFTPSASPSGTAVRGEGILASVLGQVADLHRVLRANSAPFFRTSHCVDLDRISQTSLLSRLQVARARLLAAGDAARADALPPIGRAAAVEYARLVIHPLLHGPRQMIHNALSPLSVVLGPRPRLVDWETMTRAAPEFDVAELLRYPGVRLSWGETDRLVSQHFDSLDHVRLRLAALTRAIDYAGVNARAARRSHEAGDEAAASAAAQRRAWYLDEAQTIAADVGAGAVVSDALGPAMACGV